MDRLSPWLAAEIPWGTSFFHAVAAVKAPWVVGDFFSESFGIGRVGNVFSQGVS